MVGCNPFFIVAAVFTRKNVVNFRGKEETCAGIYYSLKKFKVLHDGGIINKLIRHFTAINYSIHCQLHEFKRNIIKLMHIQQIYSLIKVLSKTE